MKQLRYGLFILLLISLMTPAKAQSQNKFEPSILILTPNKVTADKKLAKEIANYSKEIKQDNSQLLEESKAVLKEMENRDENINRMFQHKLERSRNSDFYSTIPSIAEGFLQYKFYERFNNLLIYAIGNKSDGNLNELARMGQEHGVQYVVNFPEVKSWIKNGSKATSIKVQLYDHQTGKLVIEKEYEGHDQNPGFEFACSDGSLKCTFNNALSQALNDITAVVASNNPTIQRDRALALERKEVLLKNHYSLEPESSIVGIVAQHDKAMADGGYFQGFMDTTKTKFIAFFASNSADNALRDEKGTKDRHVNIIASDLTEIDNLPSIYAYIVLGVKHNSKWYMQKSVVTYFSAEDLEAGRKEYFANLQKWNFFKENSSVPDPAFWETNFFSKVERSVVAKKDEIAELKLLIDKTTDKEDREIYQDMMDRYYEQDLKNEDYFGLYTIVADALKLQGEAERESFEEELSGKILDPFFEKQALKADTKIKDHKKLNGKRYALIYPQDRSIILCPILFELKTGKSELQYFVLIPDKANKYSIYKWTYFKPIAPQYKGAYGGDINAQLNTVTKWNFSFDYLQDKKFWEEYVLSKNGEQYEYLIETL